MAKTWWVALAAAALLGGSVDADARTLEAVVTCGDGEPTEMRVVVEDSDDDGYAEWAEYRVGANALIRIEWADRRFRAAWVLGKRYDSFEDLRASEVPCDVLERWRRGERG